MWRDWAWFRILDRSNMQPAGQRERFSVTFSVDGREAQFEVWPSSVFNPFNLSELEKFRCPSGL